MGHSNSRIVFINQATGYLTIDVINSFADYFENVALITGSVRVQDTPLHEKVKIVKIVKYNRGSNLKKALSWLTGTLQIWFILLTRFRDYDRFYFTIPPTAYLLANRIHNRFSVAVYDLYPDALKATGFKPEGLIWRLWTKRNKKLFSHAHIVVALSEKMKEKILLYAPAANVNVIHNWSAFSGMLPVPKEKNRIISRENRTGKFIVQYSGNIGVTHNVETLVEVARMFNQNAELQFLIIGRGERYYAIERMIKTLGLKNCEILPYRKDEELYESLCAADIAVVTLDEYAEEISVPSKIYNILSAGVPLMAICPSNSTVTSLINGMKLGKAFGKRETKEMYEFILELYKDKTIRQEYAENAYQASKEFTRSNSGKYLEYYLEVRD